MGPSFVELDDALHGPLDVAFALGGGPFLALRFLDAQLTLKPCSSLNAFSKTTQCLQTTGAWAA